MGPIVTHAAILKHSLSEIKHISFQFSCFYSHWFYTRFLQMTLKIQIDNSDIFELIQKNFKKTSTF